MYNVLNIPSGARANLSFVQLLSPKFIVDSNFNSALTVELKAMQLRARKQANKFSDEAFSRRFIDAISPIVESC
jgi:hypothetical protein